MAPEVLALYQTHPVVGAEELARVPGIDPLVIQAVEQHHIRRDGTGFPQQSKFSFIHICSEIIGICDEFDFRLRTKRTVPGFDVFESMKTAYPGFSRPVVAAFLRVFAGQGKSARNEPINPPPGCPFNTRCPKVEARCRAELPEFREVEAGRWVRCHFPG